MKNKEGIKQQYNGKSFVFYSQLGGDMLRVDVWDGNLKDIEIYKDYEIVEEWLGDKDRNTYYIKKNLEVTNKVETQTIVENNIAEVNEKGIQKQKKDIELYLTNILGIQKSEKIEIIVDGHKETLYTEGFVIEGYKIKYNFTQILCFFGKDVNHHIGNKYKTSKLKYIYESIKDKFDVEPSINRITDSTKARRIGVYKFVESECTYYNMIDYIKITKDKYKVNSTLEIIEKMVNPFDELLKEVDNK